MGRILSVAWLAQNRPCQPVCGIQVFVGQAQSAAVRSAVLSAFAGRLAVTSMISDGSATMT